MRERLLLLVPVLFCVASLIMWLGPYAEITARLGGVTPLEEAPVTAARIADVRAQLGDEVGLYRSHLMLDILFAGANAGMLLLLIGFAGSRVLSRWIGVFLAFPVLLFATELIENLSLLRVVSDSSREGWLAIASAATSAKFVLLATSVLIALGLWVALGLRRTIGLIGPKAVAASLARQ